MESASLNSNKREFFLTSNDNRRFDDLEKNIVTEFYKMLQRHSLVLHLFQDGDDHVKLGSLGRVFVHAEPH